MARPGLGPLTADSRQLGEIIYCSTVFAQMPGKPSTRLRGPAARSCCRCATPAKLLRYIQTYNARASCQTCATIRIQTHLPPPPPLQI
ncbi:hypothetical protein LY76DRAFT_304523 [Colletotrichum caudatum]|nr:hypothetical protein LY76DRAFT_304523 [Colletotrichum caudatum]